MKIRGKSIWGYLTPVLALGLMACSGAPKEEEAGSLSVSLTGNDSAGTLYRLRNANFRIEGYPDYSVPFPAQGGATSVAGSPGLAGAIAVSGGSPGQWSYYLETVSSEEDMNSPLITRRLVPGYYYVTLENSDWFIERVLPSGIEPVEQAVLLSPAYQGAYVWNQGSSTVVYNFGVDGDIIDFRAGDLNIQVTIERPGDQQASGGWSSSGGALVGGAASAGSGAFPSAGGATSF